MKHIINYVLLFGTGLLLLACGDKANFLDSVTPATGARVRFYHLAPDLAGVDVYVNDQKFSGVNTIPPAVAVPLSYTNSFPAQDYAILTPGTVKVKIVVPASTTASTDATIATTDLTTQADTYYSVFLYGTAPTYSTLTLTDNLTPADPTKAYIRFLNFVSGDDANATYDLLVNGSPVVMGVAPLKGAATFVAIPSIGYNATAVTVQVRPTSTTTVTASTTLQPYAGRSYTFIARGVVGGTGTKAVSINGIGNANTINR
ncbi:DUF4397 domain-containing protein [Spirosoma sp. KCTC 42546]|uniref:DUF4397 domain-containing protein n=1 Tax=Spirosoma sp. KCTC 42546 TaxID=2520506 RepID=UPI00115B82FC|nr:DUF4397 domain-containing protein [Spirosoma sp. KCTC 42546]QDK79220.1 DUF4397 domain-containing protein [Spirosoma sp. KCTC 42546]